MGIDCKYDGCRVGALPLHNDDVLLDEMPALGILQVEDECPLIMPTNDIVLVDEVVDYLELHNAKLLENCSPMRLQCSTLNTFRLLYARRFA